MALVKKEKYEICALVVHKSYRRKGIGKRLLMHTIQKLKELNPKEIFLSVSQYNIPALILYLKNGFVIVDFKKKVFDGLDRVYMREEDNLLF
ncbi:GNAT family N-acetyltransferase [Candidatus Woesearchaeota archaeon]|nr:GNAT family N-acetyltransferase [Candidatus Woesearchaeota archaeon]